MLDNDVIEEDDLRDLHGDVILVSTGLQVTHHTRPREEVGTSLVKQDLNQPYELRKKAQIKSAAEVQWTIIFFEIFDKT